MFATVLSLCLFADPQVIILQEITDGYAGKRTDTWTVHSDGVWSKRTRLPSADKRAGSDTFVSGLVKDMRSLQRAIEAARFDQFPTVLGQSKKVNDHYYRMIVGDKSVTLYEAPHRLIGEIIAANIRKAKIPEPNRKYVLRFSNIVLEMEKAIGK